MNQALYSSLSCRETLVSLDADAKKGLTEAQVLERLKRHGKNELPKPKPYSICLIFFRQFSSPLIWILFLGSFIAGFLGEWIQMSAVLAIVFVNALIGFFQEFSAEKSFQALKQLCTPKSTVIREGKINKISSSQIVPGDIVILETGDYVPADGRIIYEAQLAIQESALTGESGPIYKQTEPLHENNIADQTNMAFLGTHVVKGKGKIVVTQTGIQTELGKIASSLEKEPQKLTPLQIRLQVLGKQLTFICILFLVIISILGAWKKVAGIELALTLLSLAIAAIPEGLPAIVTITLAVGLKRLLKQNALIRKLVAVETLGCTSVICVDKTGTITKNEMVVLHFWIGEKLYDVTGMGYEPKGIFEHNNLRINANTDPELTLALTTGCLCNDAQLIQTNHAWEIIGDPTEGALLAAAAKADLWKQQLEEQCPFVGELPFDSERKRMTVLREEGHLYMKGALESILQCCNQCLWHGQTKDLDIEKINHINEAQFKLTNLGYRVLALAYKHISPQSSIDPSLETKFVFIGLVAMIDPPRPDVKEAIQICRNAQIIPVMITGDHKQTASTIAQQIGLMDAKYHIALDGIDLDQMNDEELQRVVFKTAVFSRVTAAHKLRIIQAWKSHGHVVAMAGDGVNDTLAMKHADIGIAMGITGTEVTKQISDMVILDDRFSTIVMAIKEGRVIYNNILKFIHFLLSANFGELLLIIFGFLLEFSSDTREFWAILLPSQILWINLITDGCPAIALAFDPIEKMTMLRAPRKLSEPILSRSWMAKLISIGCLVALGSIYAAYLGFSISKSVGQTMAFSQMVILELAILFLLRLPLSPISNKWLLIATTVSILLQICIIYYTPLQNPFGTVFLFAKEWVHILWIFIAITTSTIIVIKLRAK